MADRTLTLTDQHGRLVASAARASHVYRWHTPFVFRDGHGNHLGTGSLKSFWKDTVALQGPDNRQLPLPIEFQSRPWLLLTTDGLPVAVVTRPTTSDQVPPGQRPPPGLAVEFPSNLPWAWRITVLCGILLSRIARQEERVRTPRDFIDLP